jgi:1-acyl-sn-glycerol-3-phosphate acyltransferase
MLRVVVVLLAFMLLLPKLKYFFKTQICNWHGTPASWLHTWSFLAAYDFAKYWNNYEVHGLDKLKEYGGNCLLVGYHSRCSLDLVYTVVALQPSVIATHMIFKVPIMGWLFSQVNVLPSGANKKAEKLFVRALSGKRPVMLLPGGVYECLKPLSEMCKLQWKEVPGFARIIHREKALGSNTRVVPFYTKNCERSLFRIDVVYEVLGRWSCSMYDWFRRGHYWLMPLMLTCMWISVGNKILPRPVKLDTYLGDAVVLREGESVESFAERVRATTQGLIDRVEALPEQETQFGRLLRGGRASDRVRLYKLSLEMLLVGAYTVFQNTLLYITLIVLFWAPVMVLGYMCHAASTFVWESK